MLLDMVQYCNQDLPSRHIDVKKMMALDPCNGSYIICDSLGHQKQNNFSQFHVFQCLLSYLAGMVSGILLACYRSNNFPLPYYRL